MRSDYPKFDIEATERDVRRVLSFMRYEKRMEIENEDQIIKDYVANEKMMHDCYSGLVEYENRILDSNQRLLRAIRSVKGRTYHKHFLNLLESFDRISRVIEFSNKPKGEKQKESEFGRSITEFWVDQRCTGMEGDSFAGTVSVEIKPGKYLIIPYEC